MLVLLVIIWFLSGLLALHIIIAAKLEPPFLPSDVWFATSGALALAVILFVCARTTIQKARES